MAEQCHPKLGPSEMKAAWKYQKICRMKDQTISNWLGVSVAESERLEGLPPAAIFGHTEPERKRVPMESIHAGIEYRHETIRRIIADVGFVPTTRRLAAMLQAEGIVGNHVTVAKDLKVLGIRKSRVEMPDTETLFFCMQSAEQGSPQAPEPAP